MINTITDLKKRSMALGLCGKYRGMWESCRTDRELYDMATDVNGMEYLADVCTFHWGGSFDTKYISERFGEFTNGRYQRSKDGYTTALYCNHEGVISAKTTLLCVLGCKGTVIVPMNMLCTIIVGDGSDINIVNLGRIDELRIYGDSRVQGRRGIGKTTVIRESQWKR